MQKIFKIRFEKISDKAFYPFIQILNIPLPTPLLVEMNIATHLKPLS